MAIARASKPNAGIQRFSRPELTLAAIRPYITIRNTFAATMLLIIVVAGAILFMCLVGMVKFSDKNTKAVWVEVTSQILNACFTLNALLLFPGRTIDLWLAMWILGQSDVPAARKLEERHTPWMRVVLSEEEGAVLRKRTWVSIVVLQNANGWFQIPMAVAMWVWAKDYTNRPAWLVSFSLVPSFMCGLVGGVWPFFVTRRQKRLKSDMGMESAADGAFPDDEQVTGKSIKEPEDEILTESKLALSPSTREPGNSD